MIIKLTRVESNEKGTYGVLSMNGQPLCVTLERPWKYNQTDISCIPSGKYQVVKHISHSKNKQLNGQCYKLLNVPNRKDILIHIGNWIKDSQGCVLVGTSFGDDMIIDSTNAMKKILQTLPEKFCIEIHNNIF